MPNARESVCCLESTTRCQNCKHLTLAVRQLVSQSTQVFLVCVWTCGYCRQLLTKFAIPMVKVQVLEQDLLTSMLPVDHYQHSVNYILLSHTTLYRQYRYIAYRQLTTWCWGYLGKHRRVVLLSCAVNKIREAFPSDGYIGFKYPHLPR